MSEFTQLYRDFPERLAQVELAYGEPHRYYHNLTHLAEMAHILGQRASSPAVARNLLFACAYHDIIYDTQAKDNEEKSAERAVLETTEMQLPAHEIEYIRDLVLSTKKHFPLRDDEDSRVFLDADLAILGSTAQRYAEYAAAIRKEYAWVSDQEYAVGRTQILQKFLARDRIYFSQAIFDSHETRARANITFELKQFSGRR